MRRELSGIFSPTGERKARNKAAKMVGVHPPSGTDAKQITKDETERCGHFISLFVIYLR
jgi:hypothetical protein